MQISIVKISLFLLCSVLPCSAWAAGTVAYLAGTLSAQRPDGSVRVLSQRSQIQAGDILETQKDSHAQLKFDDGATITMKPNTQFAVQAFQFNPAKPEQDNVVFGLLKGGLRAVTGLIGKRGDVEGYRMNTATSTIGIRGTTFDAIDCKTTACLKHGSESEFLEAAVYVGVKDGEVVLSNAAGSLRLAAGEFGSATAATVRPQLLPGDPGLGGMPELALRETVTSGGHGRDCE